MQHSEYGGSPPYCFIVGSGQSEYQQPAKNKRRFHRCLLRSENLGDPMIGNSGTSGNVSGPPPTPTSVYRLDTQRNHDSRSNSDGILQWSSPGTEKTRKVHEKQRTAFFAVGLIVNSLYPSSNIPMETGDRLTAPKREKDEQWTRYQK